LARQYIYALKNIYLINKRLCYLVKTHSHRPWIILIVEPNKFYKEKGDTVNADKHA